MRRSRSSDISKSQEAADTQKNQAINQSTSESLSFAWHTCRDEDVADAVHNVDPDCCCNHGWEYVSPVIRIVGHDCEEEDADYVAYAGDG